MPPGERDPAPGLSAVRGDTEIVVERVEPPRLAKRRGPRGRPGPRRSAAHHHEVAIITAELGPGEELPEGGLQVVSALAARVAAQREVDEDGDVARRQDVVEPHDD